MDLVPQSVYGARFGVFEADFEAEELRKNGLRLRLPGQPFQVLRILLESGGRLVTREELKAQLWPEDTFVDFEHGLNNAIQKIREALGDSAKNSRFIETVPRRGYRFLSPVEIVTNGKPENGTQALSADDPLLLEVQEIRQRLLATNTIWELRKLSRHAAKLLFLYEHSPRPNRHQAHLLREQIDKAIHHISATTKHMLVRAAVVLVIAALTISGTILYRHYRVASPEQPASNSFARSLASPTDGSTHAVLTSPPPGISASDFKALVDAALAGNATASYRLALVCHYMAHDYGEALRWYKNATAAGNIAAMYQVGQLQQAGFGTWGSEFEYQRRARKWYDLASTTYKSTADSQRFVFAAFAAGAMHNLAELYESGQGGPRDYKQAYQLYEKVVAISFPRGQEAPPVFEQHLANAFRISAMYKLADLYANGLGVAKNNPMARQWRAKALAAGGRAAMREMGVEFENGYQRDGIFARDYSEARRWYELAAAQGDQEASAELQKPPKQEASTQLQNPLQ